MKQKQKDALEALNCFADPKVLAFALIKALMETHPDKELVDAVHKAILKSQELAKYYADGFWHGMSLGIVDSGPPKTQKEAIESIFALARQNGWKGPANATAGESQ